MAKRSETSKSEPNATNNRRETREDKEQSGISAIDTLKEDHRRIEALLADYKQADQAKKNELIRQICSESVIHIALSEEIVYPALVEAGVDEALIDAAHASHDSARHLIEELMTAPDGDRYRDAKLGQLARILHTHVASQEESESGLFAKAEKAGIDDDEIAARMKERRKALEADRDAGVLEPTPAVTFHRKPGPRRAPKEDMMDNNRPDRDERGRFVSDDDDRYSGRRASASHSSGGGSRYADNDRGDDRGRGNGGRGRSGWYGDPEGHSEASRQGWDGRRDDDGDDHRGGRSYAMRDERGRFSDDDRGRHGSYDDDRGRGGGGPDRGGWRGDPEGHSEASRRGWEGRRDDDDNRRGGSSATARDERGRFMDDDRGRYGRSSYDDDRGRSSYGDDRGRHGGWFGDPAGHSEASHRGWEMRQENGGRRSSRDDDGPDRGRDHGGWFGDREGHAEASRRGWRDRR